MVGNVDVAVGVVKEPTVTPPLTTLVVVVVTGPAAAPRVTTKRPA